jgi:L-lactate utilization protein LutB
MIDELDISQEKAWYYEQRSKLAVKNFQKRNINALYVPTREEARKAVMDMVPPGAVVARGDSISIDQIGIIEELAKLGQKVIDPLERNPDGSFKLSQEERKKLGRDCFFADVFLVGSNAVTLDGKLVNIDGAGNRVAPMIYGPDKVIVVASANKLVKDVDAALDRIHTVAAPMNARRHQLKHQAEQFADLPCVRTGACADCYHSFRICRYTVIIEGAMGKASRINVVLVGEELGL